MVIRRGARARVQVLARRIGDDAIMKAQLRHIAELAERPNLHIQILLNRQGLPGGYMSNFILLRFPLTAAPMASA
ncbi:Scr1 family TA system antitoxin-like transcriptional regulator [Nonomuraea fuscirosea]|uniref:Scr1 family TA system antitoxin-like transcriptional regulator n=1 Tax=Nonomuraea fuscirosea TaxID=1291556 RepID=UPI0034416AAA